MLPTRNVCILLNIGYQIRHLDFTLVFNWEVVLTSYHRFTPFSTPRGSSIGDDSKVQSHVIGISFYFLEMTMATLNTIETWSAMQGMSLISLDKELPHFPQMAGKSLTLKETLTNDGPAELVTRGRKIPVFTRMHKLNNVVRMHRLDDVMRKGKGRVLSGEDPKRNTKTCKSKNHSIRCGDQQTSVYNKKGGLPAVHPRKPNFRKLTHHIYLKLIPKNRTFTASCCSRG